MVSRLAWCLVLAAPCLAGADPARVGAVLDLGGSYSGHFAHHEWIGGEAIAEHADTLVVGVAAELREFRYYDDECYGRHGQIAAAIGAVGVDLMRVGGHPMSPALHVIVAAHVGLELMRAVPACQPRPTEYHGGYVAGVGLVVEYGAGQRRFRFQLAADQPAALDRWPQLEWIFLNAGLGVSWGE